jgi:hypothetical protein
MGGQSGAHNAKPRVARDLGRAKRLSRLVCFMVGQNKKRPEGAFFLGAWRGRTYGSKNLLNSGCGVFYALKIRIIGRKIEAAARFVRWCFSSENQCLRLLSRRSGFELSAARHARTSKTPTPPSRPLAAHRAGALRSKSASSLLATVNGDPAPIPGEFERIHRAVQQTAIGSTQT